MAQKQGEPREVFVSTLALPEFGAVLSRQVRDKEIEKSAAKY